MISIIIPVYNAGKYIKQCIDSCLGQLCQDFEIVVVNDGSTDNSSAVLAMCAENDNRIKIIHTSNQGVTSARKTATDNAVGEWLFFLDADDTLPNYALEELLNRANSENADLVIGDFIYLDINHKLLREQRNTIADNVICSSLYFKCTNNLWGRLVKREQFNQIELPQSEIKIGEDIICGIQLLNNSRKTVLLNKPTYNYIQYPDSTINSRSAQKVASMIPYLRWIDNYFNKTENIHLREAADFFILNEYFAFLRYGGQYVSMPEIKDIYKRTNKSTLSFKLQVAYSPFGRLAIKIAKLIK